MIGLLELYPKLRAFLAQESGVVSNGWELVETTATIDVAVTPNLPAAFPAKVTPLGVSAINLTPVVTDGATNTYDLGTAADPEGFGAGILGAQGTQVDHNDLTTDPNTQWQQTTQSLILDPPGAEAFVSGQVKVRVVYLKMRPLSA